MLCEQIEVLKTNKADREDLEDALADKADTQQVNRKVSHDQFDAAYEDISKNVEETMIKLNNQVINIIINNMPKDLCTKSENYSGDGNKF